MKFYELTYLISPDLSEEEIKLLQERINSLIQEEGGTLAKIENPIGTKLGYPISKKNKVFLEKIDFYLVPEKIENLEKKLKQESKILRYLILSQKVPKIKVSKKPLGIPKKFEKPKKEKVELKEIEKKLEEILGE